ncbi:MAG: hypothetical protein HQL67_11665 [Magnetococcales bacterium]|nr:hypothetical protein [Magnetococcales bacterium]
MPFNNPEKFFKRFQKKSKRGNRGLPIASIAFYGPDNRKATKVVVGIVFDVGGETGPLKKWFSEEMDIRKNTEVGAEIAAFLELNGVKTVAMTDGIIGCPHEEGKDYPDGKSCPRCPFWQGQDRFTGDIIH